MKRKHKTIEYQDFLHEKQKSAWRNQGLKRCYGITSDEYNRMFDEQGGCCLICGKHQSDFTRVLAVDHCHKTGLVRGLLCSRCNGMLGIYEKHKDRFQAYLKKTAKC